MPRPILALLLAGAAGAALTTAALATAGPAAAAATPLAAPSGVRLASATSSSLTVTAHRAKGAKQYRLFASATRSDVYVANIGRARKSPAVRTPRMTIGGLHYTTAPYYFRVETLSGRRHQWGAILTGGLRPATPSGLRATASAGGPYLTWTSAAVTGYVVQQATDSAFSAGRRTYTLRGTTAQFSPYGLSSGSTYYFRVQAVNNGTRSPVSAAVSMSVHTRQQSLQVMTYNVLTADATGQVEGGTPLPSWAARRDGVVALIRSRMPDVLAVQEGAGWTTDVHGRGGIRQVDDLVAALGGTYALARTEIPPTEPHYRRTGDYVLYRTNVWTVSGPTGHWDLGDGKNAAYALLRNRTTGAEVLAVSVHLAVGNGAANDTIRQRETESLLQQARAVAGSLPVVYAGDFNSNSNRNHAFDGPGRAMQAALVVDAEKAAQSRPNERYNSANLYLRTPPAVDQSIDYVYAPPGVAVASRSVLLNLSNGRFVGVIPSDHNPVTAQLYISY